MLIFNFLLVKKKSSTGLKLSNLMNIGKKKILSLEGPETRVETSGRYVQIKLLMLSYNAYKLTSLPSS